MFAGLVGYDTRTYLPTLECLTVRPVRKKFWRFTWVELGRNLHRVESSQNSVVRHWVAREHLTTK